MAKKGNVYQKLFLTRFKKAVPQFDGYKKAHVSIGNDPLKTRLHVNGQKWQKQKGNITGGRLSFREIQTLNVMLGRMHFMKKKCAYVGKEVRQLYMAFKYACRLYKYYKKSLPKLEKAYKTHAAYYMAH